ncbi:hypothetical protein BB560_000357 [Smittium megazygosporum]|uniref:Uncharacterized protein n=1 Tax=Smittium megazygosporum TaxID=133381 RepID=A0A2T9ZKI4_9FUNG|nr:hypothetical protein BB560_000357 [Smittium megazygosporum]
MRSKPGGSKKKKDFSSRIPKKSVDWADRNKENQHPNDNPNLHAQKSNTSFKSQASPVQPDQPNSTFMVGSSQDVSSDERQDYTLGLSSWQTTTTNTATSSVDAQNLNNSSFLIDSESEHNIPDWDFTSQNSIDSNQIQTHSQQVNSSFRSNPDSVSPKSSQQHSSSNNFSSSGALSFSHEPIPKIKPKKDSFDVLTSSSKQANSPLLNLAANAPSLDVKKQKRSTDYSDPEKVEINDSVSFQLIDSSDPPADLPEINSINPKDLRKDTISTLNSHPQIPESTNTISISANPFPSHKPTSLLEKDTFNKNYSQNIASLDLVNSPSKVIPVQDNQRAKYTSTIHRSLQLQRQLVQQQDLIDSVQDQLSNIYNRINYLTGTNSKYVATVAASLLTSLSPYRKPSLASSDMFYTWTSITDKPFESSVLRTAYLSKNLYPNSADVSVYSESSRNDDPYSSDTENRFGQNQDSTDVSLVEDKLWDSLMPPDEDINDSTLNNSQKSAELKDNSEFYPWFKLPSSVDKYAYYCSKRTNIVSDTFCNEILLDLSEQNFEKLKQPKLTSLLSSNFPNSKQIVQQVKSRLEFITKSAHTYGGWSDKYPKIETQNELQALRTKKLLSSTIKPKFDQRLVPSHLDVLTNAKAELRLASRTAATAARVKVAPPPRLVTNSVATLETWKGRRVPGLLNLEMYTGSTNLPAILSVSLASSQDYYTYDKQSDNSKNIRHTDQTSRNFQTAKTNSFKGIPIEFLQIKKRDIPIQHRRILSYYSSPLEPGNNYAASSNLSSGSKYNKQVDNTTLSNKTVEIDISMSPNRLVSISQSFIDQYLRVVGRQNVDPLLSQSVTSTFDTPLAIPASEKSNSTAELLSLSFESVSIGTAITHPNNKQNLISPTSAISSESLDRQNPQDSYIESQRKPTRLHTSQTNAKNYALKRQTGIFKPRAVSKSEKNPKKIPS